MAVTVAPESIVVQTRGEVSKSEAEHARSQIFAAVRHAPEPVLFVRARLTRLPGAAIASPAVVQVNLDLNGRVIRAQASRPTMREAVDKVHDRLRDRMRRADRGWEAVRGAHPPAGTTKSTGTERE